MCHCFNCCTWYDKFCSFTIRAMLQRSVTNAKTWFVHQYTIAAYATVTLTIDIEFVILVSKFYY